MSSGATLPYHLRPNKAVDRAVFGDLLQFLSGHLLLQDYVYAGMGGPTLEDFREFYRRIGFAKMYCVEADDQVHRRQEANCDIPCVSFVCDTIESWLGRRDIESEKAVIWLDFTEPKGLQQQFDAFLSCIDMVADLSLVRLTVNASPSTLAGQESGEDEQNLWNRRMDRFSKRLSYAPASMRPQDLSTAEFPVLLSHSVDIALSSLRDVRAHKIFETVYADGQQMYTCTVVVNADESWQLGSSRFEHWQFAGQGAPLRIDMPHLSASERVQLFRSIQSDSVEDVFSYRIKGALKGEDQMQTLRMLHRLTPYFVRAEI